VDVEAGGRFSLEVLGETQLRHENELGTGGARQQSADSLQPPQVADAELAQLRFADRLDHPAPRAAARAERHDVDLMRSPLLGVVHDGGADGDDGLTEEG